MKTLNYQIEIMTAALDGKPIEIDLRQTGDWEAFSQAHTAQFNWHSYDYRIAPEPAKWYENIPDGGVLCWLNGRINIIIAYNPDPSKEYVFKMDDGQWCIEPKPLTKQEIQVFMDNAPEKV